MLVHPHRVAQFSAWANARLHASCNSLTAASLEKGRGAFFDSILGTLNHILLVDLLYRERLEGRPGKFVSLAQILHDELSDLTAAQAVSDAYYLDFTHDLDEDKLNSLVGFHTLMDEPEYWEVSYEIYFSNLFQHQVHHRGQAHNMLSQAGIDPPSIGFIEFEVEQGERLVRRKS